uniref:Capsule polysaccharide biosynthesis protein n=1 Tax=Caulobacter sp. (strain K31) TaxID=366602 RepID=B0T6Z8_CAUSK
MIDGAPPQAAIVACVGVAAWKRASVARLIAADGRASGPSADLGRPAFRARAGPALRRARDLGGAVGVWPSRAPADIESQAQALGVPLVCIEDGFIRSAGLGAECRPPASIVLDRAGVHFDPRRPSDLELHLTHDHFGETLTSRAQQLIERIVALGVTKYNLSGQAPPFRGGRRTVLVPGQVEDDLSVKLGGAGVAGNLDLLRRVRQIEPDAVVLYRPHPDVEAGYRKGLIRDADALRYVDQVLRGHALPALLTSVDAVHVLTSLTGFEALLRGREVVVHGQPFYAGWGLTRDLSPPPRRGRRLALAELAAAALILYPRYIDPMTGETCSPETLVARLADQPEPRPGLLPALRRLQVGAFRSLDMAAATSMANG